MQKFITLIVINKLYNTKNSKNIMKNQEILKPIHPGEILREELLIPLNISPVQLAEAIKVPKEMIEWIYEEKAGITPDISIRLGIYFDFSPDYWTNLQKSYEEKLALTKIDEIKKTITPYAEERREKFAKI